MTAAKKRNVETFGGQERLFIERTLRCLQRLHTEHGVNTMHSVCQKIIAAAPVFPVTLAVLLWIVSYSLVFQVAIHGPGPGYMYVDSGLGRLAVGRCFDLEDRWQGVRHTLVPVERYSGSWILAMGQPFDVSYAEAPGMEEVRVWFPYWALCLACALWPAHGAYLALRRRLAPAPAAWAC